MEWSKQRDSSQITVRNKQEIAGVIEVIWLDQKYGIRRTIERRLYRYNLHSVEAYEIFSISIIRAIEYLSVYEEIPNFVAWLKITSRNIISEKSRKELRQKNIAQKMRQNGVSSPPEGESSLDSRSQLAKVLIDGLNEPDKSILLLKADGLTWKEVCIELSKKGLLNGRRPTDNTTIERIKKKGNRTFNKLKNLIDEAQKLHR